LQYADKLGRVAATLTLLPPTSLFSSSLDTIGEWWSLLIVRGALYGIRRFSDFQKSLGLAKNVLSARLKKLVVCGIMEQVPASDGSAYQEYA
jgi:DNA-binding HxlR family transcriptional regulator